MEEMLRWFDRHLGTQCDSAVNSWVHMSLLAEQVIRFIGAPAYPSAIVKGDAKPSARLFLEVIEKARQKSVFNFQDCG